MGASKGQRLSGMQKQVLSLYRGFLRAARSKPTEDRRQIESVVSAEFRRNSKQIDRKNFLYIEYLLRRGKKQLDQLKNPDTMGISSLNVSPSQNNNAKT
ncbi:Complex 1 LYR protein [Corchorus capsularis]|uniref:Complex 1 LYR protein n=1 Tax=Corchorus capsularis TaxID=210143 RepID=A0A1R3J2T2_COCAP|nr:Complex 1 LYR protein [Corchorus capsularis]